MKRFPTQTTHQSITPQQPFSSPSFPYLNIPWSSSWSRNNWSPFRLPSFHCKILHILISKWYHGINADTKATQGNNKWAQAIQGGKALLAPKLLTAHVLEFAIHFPSTWDLSDKRQNLLPFPGEQDSFWSMGKPQGHSKWYLRKRSCKTQP